MQGRQNVGALLTGLEGKNQARKPHLKRCRSCWAKRAVMTWQSSWMARKEGKCWYCCSTALARPW